MAAKKDFSKMNIAPVYNNIAMATAEETESKTENTAKKQTRGNLERRNIAFTQENYEYLRIMSKIQGVAYSDFIGELLEKSREANKEQYEAALNILAHLN